MRALYVSHNGMLEGLGQSQVLPYLRGLARRGVDFDLFSYELPDATDAQIETLRGSLAVDGIRWTPLRRRRDPRIATKVEEVTRGVVRSLLAAVKRRPDIIHGRSYLPTALGDVVATLVPRAKLIFDCRGMLGDEYVDAGYWTKERREYRLVKRYEARAFRRAEGVVVLTEALRRWVTQQGLLGPRTTLEMIPTCVDLERFQFSADARALRRAELQLEGRTVLAYAGSLGGAYLDREMARLAGIARRKVPGPFAFLVLTGSTPDALVSAAREQGLGEDEIVVRKVANKDVPGYLSAADAGLAFGKACFARMGNSPTKLAEYLACGLPVVTNADFGDQRELAPERDTCVLVESFDDTELGRGAERVLALAARPLGARIAAGRAVATARFGLETVGIPRYARLYDAVVRGRAGLS